MVADASSCVIMSETASQSHIWETIALLSPDGGRCRRSLDGLDEAWRGALGVGWQALGGATSVRPPGVVQGSGVGFGLGLAARISAPPRARRWRAKPWRAVLARGALYLG